MKIAVIADIHENAHNLIEAIKMIEVEKCEVLLCLWDVGTSKLFEVMFTLKIPVYFTFWNHDGNIIKDVKLLENYKPGWHVRSNGIYQRVKLGGRKIFLSHYDDLALDVAQSWLYDACFGAHLHQVFEKKFWKTLCVNPGEITGTYNWKPGFYIYETKTNTGKFYLITDPFLIYTPEVLDFYKNMKQ
jgi:putative phosphoesterase